MLGWWIANALAAECPADPVAVGALVDAARAAPEPDRAAAWYAAAPCLDSAGQKHLAARAWAHGIDADGKRAGAQVALTALGALAQDSGNDTSLLTVASFLPENLRSPEVAALLDLAAARDLTVAGARLEAMERLKKIPTGSPAYVEAQYRLGRFHWELGKKEDAKTAFAAAHAATTSAADGFVGAQVDRWKALSGLATVHLAADADPKAAEAALDALDTSILPLQAEWSRAWLASTSNERRAWLAEQEARAARPFLPDAKLLLGATWLKDRAQATAIVGSFEAEWGPVRDALDTFLTTWQNKPTDAWTAWRLAPVDPSLQADLAMNGRVAAYSRDLGLVALEEQALPTAWSPAVRTWARGELAKARAETTPRAGRALVGALQNRQERLHTVTSQSKKLATSVLPSEAEDAESLRPLQKPLSFLSTDWGL